MKTEVDTQVGTTANPSASDQEISYQVYIVIAAILITIGVGTSYGVISTTTKPRNARFENRELGLRNSPMR